MYNIGVHVNRMLTPDGVLRSSLGRPTMATQVIGRCTLGGLVRHLTKVRDEVPGQVRNSLRTLCGFIKCMNFLPDLSYKG